MIVESRPVGRKQQRMDGKKTGRRRIEDRRRRHEGNATTSRERERERLAYIRHGEVHARTKLKKGSASFKGTRWL